MARRRYQHEVCSTCMRPFSQDEVAKKEKSVDKTWLPVEPKQGPTAPL